MIISDPQIVPRINQHLPENIRVWDYVRVPKSFNPKNFCESRIYSYLLPTHVLMSTTENAIQVVDTLKEDGERQVPVTTEEERIVQRQFRISSEKLDILKNLSERFIGTHNFHNYTIGKSYTDTSAKRYITKFECSEPLIIDGMEWVNFQVQGQAFMLHQIRKMIGLIILTTRSNSPLSLIEDSFREPKLNVPKAPGIGLVLERPLFTTYNKTAVAQGKRPIDFSLYKDQIEEFKRNHIMSSVTTLAVENDSFDQWIKSLYTFPESFDYL
ncbi:tRNA pseudouridine synthase 1, variant 2 [Basidiobolus ranarum]